jgi:hypothetical protein
MHDALSPSTLMPWGIPARCWAAEWPLHLCDYFLTCRAGGLHCHAFSADLLQGCASAGVLHDDVNKQAKTFVSQEGLSRLTDSFSCAVH